MSVCPSDQFSKPTTRLVANHSVIEAMEIMLRLEEYTLPVYENDKIIAEVSFAAITRFLTTDSTLMIYKFNFTLESFIFITNGLSGKT